MENHVDRTTKIYEILRKTIGYVTRKYFLAFGLMLGSGMAFADEAEEASAGAEENASNPLAAVNNVDLRWQYTSADAGLRALASREPKRLVGVEVSARFRQDVGAEK